MITGRDIVLISSIEWDCLWQHPQEIALRLARAGNRVLYVENTGVRSPGIKDASRVLRRLKSWAGALGTRGVRQVAPDTYVASPVVLPPFKPGWVRAANRRLFLPLVRKAARDLGMRDVIVWTHLPTDTALDLIQLLRTPRSVVVYYCIADFSRLTPWPSRLLESEEQVARLSDVVFANSEQLAAHCARWSDNVHTFPPGVNMEAFPWEELDTKSEERPGGPQPPDASSEQRLLRSLPHPVVGYIGGLHRHVDIDLLAAMARSRPQWSWVFVGSIQSAVDKISELPNVHLLGQQPHGELVRFVRHFDVGIVPYLNTPETETVIPVKINEYLAAGKHVVSTDLPSVCHLNGENGVLTTAPGRPEDFLRAIEHALRKPNGVGDIMRRREVAMYNDWTKRLDEMTAHISAALRLKCRNGVEES